MIARVQSNYGSESRFTAYKTDPVEQFLTKEIVYHDTPLEYDKACRPRAYGTLNSCLEKVRKHYKATHDKKNPIFDGWMLRNASDLRLDMLPPKEKRLSPFDKADSNGRGIRVAGVYDKFGYQEGSSYAAIDKVLSDEPRTLKKLLKLAGIQNGKYNDHMRALIKDGVVEKVYKGDIVFFKLKEAAPEKKKWKPRKSP